MEESMVPKRPREDPLENEDALDCDELEPSKRHKPYNHILSLLESEELEDSSEDLSPLITALQQEITNPPSNSDTLLSQHNNQTITNTTTNNYLDDSSSSTTQYSSDIVVEHDHKEGVMRHLLEASDDDLGIPNNNGEDHGFHNGGDIFSSICDVLWELEDETANYYDLLQSQLLL